MAGFGNAKEGWAERSLEKSSRELKALRNVIEKYKDDLAIKNRNLDNEAARINAVRDIGVAYGQNQPKNVTYRSIY